MNDSSSAQAIGVIGALVVIFLVIKYAIRSGVSQRRGSMFSMPTGPGRFKVTGVDRQTRMDKVWHVNADNESNAKVKAELEGMIVTSVERVGR